MDLCTHAPTRRLTWHAYNCVTDTKDWVVIACCDCGAILMGSDAAYRDYLAQHGASVHAMKGIDA